MTDPAVVALALSRLADQSAPHRPDHHTVVADAEAAFRDVEDAADFLERDGETHLREAVAAAERWGDDAVAARGEALLATLERYRTAASRRPDSADDGFTDDDFDGGAGTDDVDRRPVSPRSHNPFRGGRHTD